MERNAQSSTLIHSKNAKQRATSLVKYYENGGSINNVLRIIDRKIPQIESASDLAEHVMGVLRKKAYTPTHLQINDNSVFVFIENGKDHFIPLLASTLGTPVRVNRTPKTEGSLNHYELELRYDTTIHSINESIMRGTEVTDDLLDQLIYKLHKLGIRESASKIKDIAMQLEDGHTVKRVAIINSTNGRTVRAIKESINKLRGRKGVIHCPNCDGLSKFQESTRKWKCTCCSHSFKRKDGISESVKVESTCPKCPDHPLVTTESLDLKCNSCESTFEFVNNVLTEKKKPKKTTKKNKSISESDTGVTDADKFKTSACPDCGGHVIETGDVYKCTACESVFEKSEMGHGDDIEDEPMEPMEMDDDPEFEPMDQEDDEYGESFKPKSVVFPLNESFKSSEYDSLAKLGVKIYEADEDMLVKPKKKAEPEGDEGADDDFPEVLDVEVDVEGEDEENEPDYHAPPTGPRMNVQGSKDKSGSSKVKKDPDPRKAIGKHPSKKTEMGDMSLEMDDEDEFPEMDLDPEPEMGEGDDFGDENFEMGSLDDPLEMDVQIDVDGVGGDMDGDTLPPEEPDPRAMMGKHHSKAYEQDGEDDELGDEFPEMDFGDEEDELPDEENLANFGDKKAKPFKKDKDEQDSSMEDPQGEVPEAKGEVDFVAPTADAFEMDEEPSDDSDADGDDLELESVNSMGLAGGLKESSLSHFTILETNSLSSEAVRTFVLEGTDGKMRKSSTVKWYECKTSMGSKIRARKKDGVFYAFANKYVLEFDESQITKKRKTKPTKEEQKAYSGLVGIVNPKKKV